MLATDSAEIAVVLDIVEEHWKLAAAFSFKKRKGMMLALFVHSEY